MSGLQNNESRLGGFILSLISLVGLLLLSSHKHSSRLRTDLTADANSPRSPWASTLKTAQIGLFLQCSLLIRVEQRVFEIAEFLLLDRKEFCVSSSHCMFPQ